MQAARRIDHDTDRRRGHMRAVPVKPRAARQPARARAHTRGRTEARYGAVFNTCVACLVALTAVGLVRVAIIARAAEMTLSEGALTSRIKDQRIEVDRLEIDASELASIDASSLATPSRIEEIAGATMQMGRPSSVRYISLPETDEVAADEAPASASSAGVASALGEVIGALADMSAGEAQTLLVGDVGLAGSR
jgi:cell division protein FtsL